MGKKNDMQWPGHCLDRTIVDSLVKWAGLKI